MCGLPLLYLERCGNVRTPRFFALGKPSIYLYIYIYIYIYIYMDVLSLTSNFLYIGAGKKSLFFFFFFFSLNALQVFFFFFFFNQEGSGACQHPDISDKSHSWLANSSPLEVTRVPL